MTDIKTTESAEQQVVQLDPRETYIIQTHANVRATMTERLPVGDVEHINSVRQQIHNLVAANGDAGRVAYMLFGLEFDNTQLPYGDAFKAMVSVPFDEAVQMWQKGYANGDLALEG